MAMRLTEKGRFFRILLLIATVVAWGDSDMLAEDLIQMRLAGETAIRSNVDNAYFPPFQEGSSVVDSTLEQVSVRRHAHGRAKHFKKMSAAVTCIVRQRGEADLGLEIMLDPF
jgi:hypothetical protein